MAGAGELRSELETGIAPLTFAILTAPHLASLLIEAPLLLWAGRRRRGAMIALGLFGMGLSVGAAALASTPLELALAFALYAPASGLACGFAQAALMDLDPQGRERRMTAWAFAGTLGDLAAPLLLGALAAGARDFRMAWFAVAAALVALAVAFARAPLATSSGDDDEPHASLRQALASPRLMPWLAGVALCSLLDETLVAFTALWMKERFPESPTALTAVLTSCTLGGALGLLVLDRLLLRHRPKRLLALACVGCIASYALWLLGPSPLAATVAMFLVGAFAAAHYPIAQAQAYRAAEGNSGLVAAASSLLAGFDLVAPTLLGLLADRFGLTAALVALLVQPVGLVAIALATRRFGDRAQQP